MMDEEPKGFDEWWDSIELIEFRSIKYVAKAAWNQAIDCALYLVEAKEGHDYEVRNKFEVKA